jgi:hypothetical protein
MTQELEVLYKQWKKNEDVEFTEVEESKISGDPDAGCKVSIHWKGRYLNGIVDEGYCFWLPMCDDDFLMYDFFVHIPSPDNSSGIGDVEGQVIHIAEIIKNKLVSKVEFKNQSHE